MIHKSHIKEIVETKPAIKTIFISRSLQEKSLLTTLKQHQDIKIIDESLIDLFQVRYSYAPKTQWIFFSSKNGIKYFFAQHPELKEDVKYGVISQASADYLNTFGKYADFIGTGVNMTNIANNFREVLNDDSVLFPQAIDSLQTIQKQLSFKNTSYNLYVYKTIIKPEFNIPYTDVVIFTSPSNVTAYMGKYKIDSRQKIIAMGEKTKYKLSEYGIRNVSLAHSFDENGLYNAIAEL